MKRENRLSSLWPLKTEVIYLDAWGLNPVKGKVVQHYDNPHNIRVEDAHGIVHFGQTWRIDGDPPSQFEDDFADLLGTDEPKTAYDFEDLLG